MKRKTTVHTGSKSYELAYEDERKLLLVVEYAYSTSSSLARKEPLERGLVVA